MPSFYYFLIFVLVSSFASAETIKIDFTSDDSYSIEVANIGVGDTIEWLPKNEGHNVEFLAGPNMNDLPKKSDLNAFYSVTFNFPGVYLYQCSPHAAMGMIGIVVVGGDTSNMDAIAGKKVTGGKSKKKVKKLLSEI